ncbi:uncharacterized protein LOC113240481 [Hyposmocoma kahamanoa]|uniref:uncharacterized protein LOC113225554 n=1 Tax=Hyposmocoma kahamanoa TaxID=1477025 RepID=UPI000E6D6903|nr:uncharacterized protein LOC113225554 [Hyposmocoma kahamanoa]XP_026333593.1 uncharacterized protein LOC113240481 [Hyposmocoma kahamanoa]
METHSQMLVMVNRCIEEKVYLQVAIVGFIENNGLNTEETSAALQNLNKLKELEVQKYLTDNKYFLEIALMTEVSISTLKRINYEGKVNQGILSTPAKKCPHKATEIKLMNIIHCNEYI